MFILTKDPKELLGQNPCEKYICSDLGNCKNPCLSMVAWVQKQAVLAHVKEVDIDKLIGIWLTKVFRVEMDKKFSDFLEEKLK